MSKLRTHKIFESSRLSLAAVERVDTRHRRSTAGCHFIGTIAPIAIVVSTGDERYALDMTGQPVDLDELERDLSDADDGAP